MNLQQVVDRANGGDPLAQLYMVALDGYRDVEYRRNLSLEDAHDDLKKTAWGVYPSLANSPGKDEATP